MSMAGAIILPRLYGSTQIVMDAGHVHAWIHFEERSRLQCRGNMINRHPVRHRLKLIKVPKIKTAYTGQSSGLGMCVVPMLK